jgi:hypothetical protein
LNSYGYIVCHCGVVNSAEGAADYGRLSRRNSSERGCRQVLEKLVQNKVPVVVRKLADKGCEVMKLTVAEIELVQFSVYNISMDGSKLRKADYVSALEKEMSTNILKYESFVCNIETIVPVSEAAVIVAGECRAESGHDYDILL